MHTLYYTAIVEPYTPTNIYAFEHKAHKQSGADYLYIRGYRKYLDK